MFPVDMARTAYRTLAAAGAAITYREIADLSHAYPRDGQGEVLDWWLRASDDAIVRLRSPHRPRTHPPLPASRTPGSGRSTAAGPPPPPRMPTAATASRPAPSRPPVFRPRAPSSSGAPLIERIIASAVSGPNGQRWKTTSFSTSTKMPPRPNIAIGPNTGSRWMPRMHSTPPFSCFATSTPSIRAVGRRRLGAFQQQARSRNALTRHRQYPAARRRFPICA